MHLAVRTSKQRTASPGDSSHIIQHLPTIHAWTTRAVQDFPAHMHVACNRSRENASCQKRVETRTELKAWCWGLGSGSGFAFLKLQSVSPSFYMTSNARVAFDDTTLVPLSMASRVNMPPTHTAQPLKGLERWRNFYRVCDIHKSVQVNT